MDQPEKTEIGSEDRQSNNLWDSRRKWIAVGGVVVILSLLSALLFSLYPKPKQKNNQPIRHNQPSLKNDAVKTHPMFGVPCQNKPDTPFPHDLTDSSKLAYVNPTFLGEQFPRFRTFLWIDTKKTDKVPVYAPVDSDLVEGVYKNARGALDYDLHFMVSCDVWYLINHITDPTDKVKKVLNQEAATSTKDYAKVSPPIHFSAGELLGYTSGTPLPHNFDIGVFHLADKNKFVNQARYEADPYNKFLTAICPFDAFDTPIKNRYYQMFGEDGQIVPNATCGPISPDKGGTISGSWFDSQESSSDPMLHFKLMIGTYIDRVIRISGEDFPSLLKIAPSNPTYMEPLSITTEHCYHAGNQFVYFKSVSPKEMRVASGIGVCPSSFPFSYKTYYR